MAKKFIKVVDWYIHAAFIVALGLGISGFCLPPSGQIDPSVITFIAEILGGASLCIFLYKLPEYIRAGITAKISHGDTTIELKKNNTDDTTDNNSTNE